MPLFIAEVKTQSPFGFSSKYAWGDLLATAIEYGDMVSVHTDPRWGGSMTHIARASRAVHSAHKLLLAKGIHPSDDEVRRALDFGADLVLTVGRRPAPELVPLCLIEPQQCTPGTPERGERWVWNSRNLPDGGRRTTGFAQARAWWPNTWLCQASNIATPEDVHPGADAFIVGANLPSFCASMHSRAATKASAK